MRTHRSILAFALSILLPVLLTACGDDDTTAPPDDGPFNGTIRVVDNRFSPASVTISAGDSVTWRWEGNATHTVTHGTSPTSPPPGSKLFDSGFQDSGTFGYRFNDPGTFPYYCDLHRATGMTGTVTVQ